MKKSVRLQTNNHFLRSYDIILSKKTVAPFLHVNEPFVKEEVV